MEFSSLEMVERFISILLVCMVNKVFNNVSVSVLVESIRMNVVLVNTGVLVFKFHGMKNMYCQNISLHICSN